MTHIRRTALAVALAAGLARGGETPTGAEIRRAEIDLEAAEARLRAIRAGLESCRQDLAQAQAQAASGSTRRVAAQAQETQKSSMRPGSGKEPPARVRLVYDDGAEQVASARARIPGLMARLATLEAAMPEAEAMVASTRERLEALRGTARPGGPGPDRRKSRWWTLADGREIEGRSAITCDGVTRITTISGEVIEIKNCDIMDRP